MSWDSRPLNSITAWVERAAEDLEAEEAVLVASETEDDVILTSGDARNSLRGGRFFWPFLACTVAGLVVTALAHLAQPNRWLSQQASLPASSLAEAGSEAEASARLLCFSVSMTEGYEVKLIKAQYEANVSIFACDKWHVFSMESFALGKGVMTTAIPGAPARWEPQETDSTEVSVFNTRPFLRAWGKIGEAGLYKVVDWVVKTDVDSVFLPARLKQEFLKDKWSWVTKWGGGVFIKNCFKWNSMQGPLEILSRVAATKFIEQMDTCKQSIPMDSTGEDQFLDQCLGQLDLLGLPGFEMLNDFYCDGMPKPCDCANGRERGAISFHPCKSRKSYFECQKAAQDGVEDGAA